MSAPRVLIVEDEKPLRDVYELILSRAGYAVETATNGRDGLASVERAVPDFILLDVFMPVMNGLDFMRALGPDVIKATHIVVFSNNSDSGVHDEAVSLGARDVILKSDISPSSLINLVAGYVHA